MHAKKRGRNERTDACSEKKKKKEWVHGYVRGGEDGKSGPGLILYIYTYRAMPVRCNG
jgi:hypothetical protein